MPTPWRDLVSSTLSTLTVMRDVYDITQDDRPATTVEAMEAWEKRFHPINLPADVKSFLMSSDGLKVVWQVRHGDDVRPLGVMYINALADITSVPPEALLNECGERCVELPPPVPGSRIQVFDLDAQCSYGRVCLISTGGRREHARAQEVSLVSQCGLSSHLASARCMREPGSSEAAGKRAPLASSAPPTTHRAGRMPQVWFQDLGCTWWFLANTFTDYVKLMLAHLGLPHWQYAFTENGVDPVAKHWFGFLALHQAPATDSAVEAMFGSTAFAQFGATHERSRANTVSAAGSGKPVVRRKASASRRSAARRGAAAQVDE